MNDFLAEAGRNCSRIRGEKEQLELVFFSMKEAVFLLDAGGRVKTIIQLCIRNAERKSIEIDLI